MADGKDPAAGISLFPGVLLRGVLMGAADIVPGVSGGTVAFITGIYQRLLAAISAADVVLLRELLRGGWRSAWQRLDGAFLLALFCGIAISIFSLARLISAALESHPLQLWSFFFGLILASALVLNRHVATWRAGTVAGLLAGALLAAAVGVSPATELPIQPLSFFIAGFFAICAMILPGISGSFILVLAGMYEPVLEAIESLELLPLGCFGAGAACGLLLFSRLLNYLLREWHAPTLATLTGFLYGSLVVVWPWKLPSQAPGTALPVLPQRYAEAVADPHLLACVGLMLLGFAMVWLLESRWGGPER